LEGNFKFNFENRFGTTEEMADSVVFLLSKNSSFITGIALPIDGGLSAI
jgi:NAD(P)-dependent dehydrogenase (short-subunit alcohol dehydrogenase family)